MSLKKQDSQEEGTKENVHEINSIIILHTHFGNNRFQSGLILGGGFRLIHIFHRSILGLIYKSLNNQK